MKLTKEQALIVSGYTGVLCLRFALYHEDIEKRLGRPVFTREIPRLIEDGTIPMAYREDFISISCDT